MRIHGLVFIIVGSVVSIYSYAVDPRNLRLFVWFGLGMLIFGIFRLFIDHINKPKEPKKHKHHNSHQHVQRHSNYRMPVVSKFCHGCGSAVHDFQNFCHMCGTQMMHKR